jgi:DNA processing protein
MSQEISFQIQELENMRKYPKELFYKGDLSLLKRRKISIVGTRKPSLYSQQLTHRISSELSKRGIIDGTT